MSRTPRSGGATGSSSGGFGRHGDLRPLLAMHLRLTSPTPPHHPWRRRQQGHGQHVIHLVDPDERHVPNDVFGNLGQILLVLLRQDEFADALPMRGQDLLAQPADWQHAPTQRDLSCHADLARDRPAGKRRNHRQAHGDTGRGTVLGNGAGGNVDVDVGVLPEWRVDSQGSRAGADIAVGSLSRFAHDLAELAGKLQVALAVHDGDLDGHQITTGLSPGDARGDANLVVLLGRTIEDPLRAEVFLQRFLDDGGRQGAAADDLLGYFAADGADLAFQVTDTRLVSVFADHVAQSRFREAELAGLEAMLPELFWHQELLGDVDLLFLDVARQLDDFHAIPQRRHDRVEDIGGGDEQHLRQVVLHLQVMVGKGGVLLGIEYF